MLPILYSFRRCPYAMRARLALAIVNLQVELREVVLKDKPQALLDLSAKATVPVLLTDSQIIDESMDILLWVSKSPVSQPLWHSLSAAQKQESLALITYNDGEFKAALDRYKYADRHPQNSQQHYRQIAEKFLQQLELQLSEDQCYLLSNQISLVDLAILPFIRQFALVNWEWFATAPYPQVRRWLEHFLASDLFKQVMHKYPQWQTDSAPIIFPPTT